MKISELNDEDVLHFLMTNDFDDDYSPSELKYLIVKWRYFYRMLNGRSDQVKTHNEGEIRKLKEELEISENNNTLLKIELVDKENIIDSLKNRDLSLMERIKGKIILKDEDKGI